MRFEIVALAGIASGLAMAENPIGDPLPQDVVIPHGEVGCDRSGQHENHTHTPEGTFGLIPTGSGPATEGNPIDENSTQEAVGDQHGGNPLQPIVDTPIMNNTLPSMFVKRSSNTSTADPQSHGSSNWTATIEMVKNPRGSDRYSPVFPSFKNDSNSHGASGRYSNSSTSDAQVHVQLTTTSTYIKCGNDEHYTKIDKREEPATHTEACSHCTTATPAPIVNTPNSEASTDVEEPAMQATPTTPASAEPTSTQSAVQGTEAFLHPSAFKPTATVPAVVSFAGGVAKTAVPVVGVAAAVIVGYLML